MNTWNIGHDVFLKLLFNLSVHACVRTYVRAQLGSAVRGLITSGVTPQERCLPHFQTRSLIGLEFTPVWLAKESQGSACISRITRTHFHAWLLIWFLGLSSGKQSFTEQAPVVAFSTLTEALGISDRCALLYGPGQQLQGRPEGLDMVPGPSEFWRLET